MARQHNPTARQLGAIKAGVFVLALLPLRAWSG
jgi:hypothetical protein